jgi:hypothetical protein
MPVIRPWRISRSSPAVSGTLLWKNRTMANPAPSPDPLEQRVASLAEIVNRLIGVVSRLDDETSDTAAAAFDSDVPRVAGHKATAAELKRLSDTLDSWRKEWAAGNG